MNRLDALQELLKRDPGDALLHYMLANEYYNAGHYAECVTAMTGYLTLVEDEGAAYRTLGQALIQLGRIPEARQAYEAGMAAARKFAHPTMAEEFAERLRDLV